MSTLIFVQDNTIHLTYSVDYAHMQEVWKYQAHLRFSNGKAQFDAMLDGRLQNMLHKIIGMHTSMSVTP